jgi:ankyrin repeat protein
VYNCVLKSLLAHRADPNRATIAGIETEAFMRDCRTKGEMPLHRAAAFGNAEAIPLLLDAGAVIDARDAQGDTPLSWASWYLRPRPILRMLCYGSYTVRA